MHVLLLAALALTSPARPTNVCVAMQFPMPASGAADLSPEAVNRIDRFLRGSPLEMEWPRHALGDRETILLIVAPYGDNRGLTQNERLTRSRGEAIRLHMLRHRDRWNWTPGRLQIVELRDAARLLERAGVRRDPARRHDAYVLIDYPADRLSASAAGTSPPYCGEVFSR